MIVLRRSDLRDRGWDDNRITRSLRRGRLVRVDRDRYVEPGLVPSREQVLARPGGRTALGHASAARAWALPAADPRTHLVVPHGCRRRGRSTRGVVVHQSRRWEAVEISGVAVTDVVTTVVDVLRTADLAEAVAVTDAALRAGKVQLSALESVLTERRPSHVRARRALGLADARAESPLESRLRLLLTLAGLPPDEVQHTVREDGSFVARVDLWYDGLVVEADGYEFHRDRADYVADRRKAQAYARLGLWLLRFSWEDVHQRPDEVVETVRRVLATVPARRAA